MRAEPGGPTAVLIVRLWREAALADRVTALEQELAALRAQLPRRRRPRRTDS